MFNIVKIGEKDVPMLSMASVDLYYRAIFHKDSLKAQLNVADEADTVNFYAEIAFVMAKFAETKDRKTMLKLSEDAFVEWLDQFERPDLINALPDIQATYDGQRLTTVDAKKNNDEPSDS